MHVGVPLYREHEVLVRLVAVPAAAIMWCNQPLLGEAVSHRHPAPPTRRRRRTRGTWSRCGGSQPGREPRPRCAGTPQAPARARRTRSRASGRSEPVQPLFPLPFREGGFCFPQRRVFCPQPLHLTPCLVALLTPAVYHVP